MEAKGSEIPSCFRGYLTGRVLVAMPHMKDARFRKSLVFVCWHDDDGAMGIMLNQSVGDLTVQDLFMQMDLPASNYPCLPVLSGGPIDESRGFILHTSDYQDPSTLVVGEHFALTSTIDILSAVAQGRGPNNLMFALGYAGWTAGQLEAEVQSNAWLHVDPDEQIIFNVPPSQKWCKSIEKLGIHEVMLSEAIGHA